MSSLFKTALIVSVSLFFAGCNTLGVGVQGPGASGNTTGYHKQGPPPHAPAHGYRHKHQHGHQMQYDSNIGAYIVLNIPETYFGNNLYIRISTDGRWIVSTKLDGNWRLAVGNEIPPKLKNHKQKKSYNKSKGEKSHNKDKGKKSKKGKGHKKNKYSGDNGYEE